MQDQFGFLHRHPGWEQRAELGLHHAIVDYPDWRDTRNILDKLPLSAEGARLMPGTRAFSLGKEGAICPVIVEMIGLRAAGFVQVRHADGTDGVWLEATSELYVNRLEAAHQARRFRAARNAYLAGPGVPFP
jgi:hypothetical protein